MKPSFLKIQTDIIPAKINTIVAMIDRADKRLMPHTPCPLVHPPLSAVPKPTSTPAITTVKFELVNWFEKISGLNHLKKNPPQSNPAKNINLLRRSKAFFVIADFKIPLTPATSPLNNKSTDAATPINDPPISA